MTIGEALAEARHQAGLTVDELSERTRIREAVIRGIEQDDYAACGGDIYVRGYVRAIAGAVGIDAQPLIRDFDAGRASAAAVAPNEFAQDLAGSAMTTLPQPVLVAEPAPEPPEPAPEPPEAAPEPEPEPEPPTVVDLLPVAGDPEPALAYPEPTRADLELTLADLEFVLADPEFPTEDPGIAVPAASPVTVSSPVTVASPITTASAVTAARPVEPGQPSAWRARLRGRRWVTGVAILVVIALAIAGFSGSRIVTHLRHPAAAGNAATGQQKAPSRASHGPGANTPGAASKPKGNPAQRAPHALVHWLPILRVTSFGPDGTADGDNPQGAQWAIASHSPSPWQTDWYASPAFGMLKPGTGLLLDMGKTVTISSLRIDLSPYRGADLQLRVGRTASDLRVAARADDVGGTVRLKLLSPRRARYVLIWFTLLPPDGAGTYQESVYRIVVNGRT